jgi:hypothetical protein
MKTTTRTSLAAIAAAAFLFIALFFSANEATAACSGIKVRNNTSCNLLICWYNATFATSCQVVNAMSSTPATWPAGFMPIGVQSAAGNFYPWGAGCTICMSVQIPGAVGSCCVMVCPNPAQCAVDINPCAAPCAP